MKVLKKLGIVSLVLLISACSSDDDGNGGMQGGIDVSALLTSGKWYQESITPGSFTDCEKNTSVEFTENGDVFIESFDDNTGACESLGIESGTFTLTNDRDVVITSNVIIINIVIDAITAELLIVRTSDGDTITFDKVQG